MLAARIIARILVAAFVLLLIDGFLHRDPTVELGNGYEIVAVSAASPCVLNYSPWLDSREFSDWHAVASSTIYGPNGPEQTPFLLTHDELGWLEFDDEDEWQRQSIERKATIDPGYVGRVEGITGFRSDGRYVAGAFDKGFFLLDTYRNELDTYRDRNEWSRSVASVSSLDATHLKNPKSWFVQSRNVAVLAVPAAIFLPWCLWPLRRGRGGLE